MRYFSESPSSDFSNDDHSFDPDHSEVLSPDATDYTKAPPFELKFFANVPDAPPVFTVEREALRVCVFQEEDIHPEALRRQCWLTLELQGNGGEWRHMVTMHEANVPILVESLLAAAAYVTKDEAPGQAA